MSQNIAVEQLLLKRQQLIDERGKMVSQFDQQISNLDSAIETLSGHKVYELQSKELYDDSHPDYIKSSAEEI